jgi:hypothetical protein
LIKSYNSKACDLSNIFRPTKEMDEWLCGKNQGKHYPRSARLRAVAFQRTGTKGHERKAIDRKFLPIFVYLGVLCGSTKALEQTFI